jgi:biopolymer transport protein ExbD
VIAVVLILVNLGMTGRFLIGALATLHLQTDKQVTLPIEPDAKRYQHDLAVTLRFEVSADGVVHIDHQPVEDSAIVVAIHERRPERVLIAADRNTRYERLKDLIAKVRDAGVGRIIFSVVDHDDPAPPRQAGPTPAVSPSP